MSRTSNTKGNINTITYHDTHRTSHGSNPATDGTPVTPSSTDAIESALDDWLNRHDSESDRRDAYQNYDNPLVKLLMSMKYMAGGDADANLSLYQLLFQYLTGEQNYQRNLQYSELNYERSKAANQVALMMQAGMSRAAALQAVQGGSSPQALTSDTQVSPFQSAIEGHRSQRWANILDTIDTATKLANQIVALASAPYDLTAKSLTNKLLTNQADMLQMQVQGMQDAAAFAQAVANTDAQNNGFKVADLPINEQYAYFQNVAKMKPMDKGFDPSAFFYGNSQSFQRAASNPFFWASYSDAVKNRNSATASIFAPDYAAQQVSQLRAATRLTQNQAFAENYRGKLLQVDGFIAECTANARKDLESLKIECERLGYEFDKERARQFLDRVNSFTQLDFLQLDYEIQRLSEFNDPELFARQKSALVGSLDYEVANYMYMHSLASLKNGVLSSMIQDNPDAVNSWVKYFLQYHELGQTERVNNATNVARTIFSGVTAGAAGAFAGYKIWGGITAAKAAAAAKAVATKLPPPPPMPIVPSFSSAVPLVMPTTMQYMMPNGLDGGMYDIQ